MRYSDQTEILEIAEIPDLRLPGRNLDDNHHLKTEQVKDDDDFQRLYELWIKRCVEFMSDFADEPEEKPLLLFYPGADAARRQAFLNRFEDFILGIDPYRLMVDGAEFAVWEACPSDEIFRAIDESLKDAAPHDLLRVKVICLLMNAFPERVFAEGVNWPARFLQNAAQEDFLDVRDGTVFRLYPEPAERFYPRTLRNPGKKPCRVSVLYADKTYSVTLPPSGCLRAVFADEGGKRLVSVKGNISFNDPALLNAVVQTSGEKGAALLMAHKRYRNALFPLETGGAFTDASANGTGGALALTAAGLFDLHGQRSERKEQLPMRLYCAGHYWVWHYSDGTIESNLPGREQRNRRVIAVVENADQSILLLEEDGARIFKNGKAEECEEHELVDVMMERFQYSGAAELCRGEGWRITVLYNGESEVDLDE